MGEVSGYEHDIFISYARDDNGPTSERRGWIDRFLEEFENQLKRRRGFKNLSIWQDELRMDGAVVFNDSIEKAIQSSFLFFAFHSRNYQQSDYCQKELRWFHEFHQKSLRSLRVGDHLRIFNLLLGNFHHQQWPEAFQDTTGFVLHDANSPDELGDFTNPRSELFESQLRKVVDAVDQILADPSLPPTSHQQQEAEFPPVATPESSESSSLTVFFADVADSLTYQRKKLIAETKQLGITDIKKIPPPYSAQSHNDQMQKALEEAQLTVHLLDEWPGREIEGQENTTYPQSQLKFALNSPLPQLIWVPKTLQLEHIEEPIQRQLIEGLETGKRTNRSYEFIRSSPLELIDHVCERIQMLQVELSPSEAPASFLVDTHQKDQFQAFQLAQLLAQQRVHVEFSQESYDPVRSLDLFEEMAQRVKNLIFLFGRVEATWLKRRIEKVVKIAAEQFMKDSDTMLETVWILLLPGNEGPDQLPKLPPLLNIRMLDNTHREEIDPDRISPLFSGGSS